MTYIKKLYSIFKYMEKFKATNIDGTCNFQFILLLMKQLVLYGRHCFLINLLSGGLQVP